MRVNYQALTEPIPPKACREFKRNLGEDPRRLYTRIKAVLAGEFGGIILTCIGAVLVGERGSAPAFAAMAVGFIVLGVAGGSMADGWIHLRRQRKMYRLNRLCHHNGWNQDR